MATRSHKEQLSSVYGAQTIEDLASSYDEWMEQYDAQMREAGYRHPMICVALLARYVPRGETPVLDAGAGTGLIGEWLKILGYASVEGFDVSEGMLAAAERKGFYEELRKAVLGERLPYPDDHFAGVVCAGVFTFGHAGPEGLDELLRVVRPGGHVVITVKDGIYEDFAERIERLRKAGRCRQVEMTPSYVSMPNQKDHTSTSRALVLEVGKG